MIERGNIYRPLDDEDWPDIRARAMTIVKWLRQHGSRGVDYESSGAGKSLSIWFSNDRIETAYIMTYEWTK